MPIPFIATLAALLYLVATGLQLLNMLQRRKHISRPLIALCVAALACHAIVAWDSIASGTGLHLGFYKISALIFLATNILCLASILLRRPLQNLLLIIFPLSALAVLVSTFGPQTHIQGGSQSPGLLAHIGSSVLAYAVLCLAAIQAALVAIQDYQLRHRHPGGIVRLLPPLQLMETMLFELLWAGVILLTLAIASGFIFVDDLFAQHLVHKTALTIVAWITFTTLLWGHYQLGWRSQTAVRFTLAGFLALMLAFFGSKLVLELILN
ncbi:cytochrome c biogenesis protein CcsA [Parahaliea sp. F7430]|uniref:Cytochrome c biogenesis protein CcsA n=1 Tax=Sediminihaliea albiluteola TaxID=2758564 RepID=A0A7W2TXF4_9GAMM|nr:cytochrome c biogenesis protein CcsA [Sediminihaliea albiluteola]MBA6413746.1 cytochrome c biogenesis protein CcsA [Sediminihaliea albiluteola]